LMRDPRREFRLSYRNAVRSLWRRAPLGHALVATLYMVVAWGRAGRRRGYGLTHLQATLGLGHDIARILWRRERHPVSAEPYCLMEYLTDHWVSSWDEVDGSRVHRYGALWRKAWRRLRGRRLVSLTDGPGRPQAGVGESP